MAFIRKPITIMLIVMSLYTTFVFGFTCPKKNDKNNPNGLYANPTDCCTFYQCANGHPYVMNCPDGLQWSTKRLRCEWPKNSDCGVNATSSAFTCPEKNDENNPNGLYANPSDCSTFYQCSNGKSYLMNCPDDLQWSTKLLRCEWPENSDCGVEPSKDFTCPKKNNKKNPNGLYANSKDCCTFYQCANGHPYLMNCPDGLQWSTKRLRCEWPENSDCGAKSGKTNSN
ncbi:6958_t:CDS:2 [Dentiscutata erythropus]|uniref:6958_t:CDS:1 n=1 Tax=Dentiscutata erythropus TaxID=1348616 RepID=A0A9N9AIG9_9GLOM|nr:6958_t:CDS:2 [Dentiscutata erythropus]